MPSAARIFRIYASISVRFSHNAAYCRVHHACRQNGKRYGRGVEYLLRIKRHRAQNISADINKSYLNDKNGSHYQDKKRIFRQP